MREEWLYDVTVLRDVLRRRLLRAMVTAAGSLQRVCRGHPIRGGEDEREALRLLCRLAPSFLGGKQDAPEEPLRSLAHPSLTPERVEELTELLELGGKRTPEEAAQLWAGYFRERGPKPGNYDTLEQAMAHGRSLFEERAENERLWQERDRAERAQREALAERLRRGEQIGCD